MTYDQWKTTDRHDYEQDACCHEEFEINWEGRAFCEQCGHAWWASSDQIRFQSEQQAEYDAWTAKQARREFWRKLTLPIRWPIFRLLERVWPRKSLSVLTDDEIPF